MKTSRTLFAALAAMFLCPAVASAHFPFLELKREGDAATLHVYFSELAEPDDPALLDRLVDAKVFQKTHDGEPKPLAIQLQDDSLTAAPKIDGPTTFLLTKDYGTLERNGESFKLLYYAKTHSGRDAWKNDTSHALKLDIVPARKGDDLTLTVLWQGKPLPDAELVIQSGREFLEAKTDAEGNHVYKVPEPGLYSVRVKHVEDLANGESAGQTARHYSTLTLDLR